jgi:hypothetical protein
VKKWLFVANSVLVFPFAYILLGALLNEIGDALHMGWLMNGDFMGALIGTPMILAYVCLPDFGPFLLPLLTALGAFSLWKIWPHRRVLLMGYLLVYLLYDIYLVWWYATGQRVHLEL